MTFVVHCNDVIYHTLEKTPSRVKSSCQFCSWQILDDFLSLNLLPVTEQRNQNLLKLMYRALYNPKIRCQCTIRNTALSNSLQDHAASLFNELPSRLEDLYSFKRKIKNYLLAKARARLLSTSPTSYQLIVFDRNVNTILHAFAILYYFNVY